MQSANFSHGANFCRAEPFKLAIPRANKAHKGAARVKLSRAWQVLLLNSVILFAVPAKPQTVDTFRPEVPTFDRNNVDVSTGYFSKRFPLISNIDNNAGWMDFTYQYQLNYGWSSNVSGRLNIVVDRDSGYTTVTISYGSDFEQFTYYSSGSYAMRRNGFLKMYDSNGNETAYRRYQPQAFVPAYAIWTDRDGRKVWYKLATSNSQYDNTVDGGDYAIDKIELPTGITYKYHYITLRTNATIYPDILRLQSITNNLGYQLKFEYQSDNQNEYIGAYRKAWLISKVIGINNAHEYCDPLASRCTLTKGWPSFSATGNYDLGSFIDSGGQTYLYNLSGNTGVFKFNTLSSSGYNMVYNTAIIGSYVKNGINYGTNYTKRVTSAVVDEATTEYSYVDTYDNYNTTRPATVVITVKDPLLNKSSYTNSITTLSTFTDEIGRIRKYSWLFPGKLASLTNSEGDMAKFFYDNRGNMTSVQHIAKPVAAQSVLSNTFVYPLSSSQSGYASGNVPICDQPAVCNKPTATVDGKNHQTDFTYTAYGRVASEMGPPPSAGAPRPLMLYSYVQKSAYSKNSSGALVASDTPVWMPSTKTACQTKAGSSTLECDPSAPIEVASYEYGADGTPNNVLVRGVVVTADGISLRSCSAYDDIGRKISQSTPRADLKVCA